MISSEEQRILEENRRRERELPADLYAPWHPPQLFLRHAQERALLWGLRVGGQLPLAARTVLEVGCGRGRWLRLFETFGARQSGLTGVDIDRERVHAAAATLPAADVRVASASELPFEDGRFDVTFQATVFTSILDPETRRRAAAEMLRVTRDDGVVLWWDFAWNNPSNPAVRRVSVSRLRRLFPGCRIRTWRAALAPPLARILVPRLSGVAAALQALRLLNSHYLAVIRRPA